MSEGWWNDGQKCMYLLKVEKGHGLTLIKKITKIILVTF